MFINIHSHNPANKGEWSIRSISKDFDHTESEGPISIGLHPWHINPASWNAELEKIKILSQSPQVVAIGECGLDKVCHTDWALQVEVFSAQLLWVNEIQKPLIIHCVRAYDDILRMLTDRKLQSPCIFHGFNRNREIAGKIISQGHYLSFGAALQHGHVRESLQAVPPVRFFLETDDSGLPIADIYQLAAETLGMSVDDVISQIRQNTKSVFGITIA